MAKNCAEFENGHLTLLDLVTPRFVWISEQMAIISLYSMNWLVFITETESVYCAVRA